MLNDSVRQEIAIFIEREAAAYLSLRSSMFGLQKEIFSDLIVRRNGQLSELESTLEQFALLQIELSEGMFNNAYNGQLAPAAGIAAWQQELFGKAAQFCYQDGVFQNWSTGNPIVNADFEKLLTEAHRQQTIAGIRTSDAPGKLSHIVAISEMRALDPERLDLLYQLSAAEKNDEVLTSFVLSLLLLDVRICFEMTALVLHVALYAGAGERSGAFIEILQTIESGLRDLETAQNKSAN